MMRTSALVQVLLSSSILGPSAAFAQRLCAPQGRAVSPSPAFAGIAGSAGVPPSVGRLDAGLNAPSLSGPAVGLPLPSVELHPPVAEPRVPATRAAALTSAAQAPVAQGLRVLEPIGTPSARAEEAHGPQAPVLSGPSERSGQAESADRTDPGKPMRAVLGRAREAVQAEWSAPSVDLLFSESDVLLLGESHHSLSSLRWLAGRLPRMKEAGVKYVGLEWVSQAAEEHINAYLDGEEDFLPLPALGAVEKRHPEVEALFKAMKETGIRVLGLTQPEVYWLREMGRRAARNLGVPEAEFLEGAFLHKLGMLAQGEADREYREGINEAIAEVGITLRNAFMAKVFKERLAPGEKAVALVGYDHLEYPDGAGPETLYSVPAARYGNLAQALRDAALRAFSLMLTGGAYDQPEHRASDLGFRAKLYRFLRRVLPAKRDKPEAPAYARVSDRVGVFHMGGPVDPGDGVLSP